MPPPLLFSTNTGAFTAVTPNNPLPVTGGGTAGTPSTGVTTVQGIGYTGTSTVTRAANQTPYTAGDVVGGALTIATVGPTTGDVLITAIRLMPNLTAIPSGMTSFTLYLYNVTPPSAIADNSPFTLGSGDRAAFLDQITGITPSLLGISTSTPFASIAGFLGQFTIAAGGTLYGYLVTAGAYTPAANSETYTLTIKGVLP